MARSSTPCVEAKIVIESWRRHYNAIRPHASLGYRAPAPEVFVPALAAWPAAQLQSAAPGHASLAYETELKLTSNPDHSVGADQSDDRC
jgi:hypothetical protein